MSGWREGFHRDVLTWLARVPASRPHADWGTPAEIVDITEAISRGFGGSSVTAGDDPAIELTITWRDTEGIQHVITEAMTLTELMKELTGCTACHSVDCSRVEGCPDCGYCASCGVCHHDPCRSEDEL
ncbi:hypothetical protein [Nocardia sp. NBC_00511]|uniref:hypothetical protein n=1 Tax=Nocardia sp. NBC_00511 TaxID=2903591 RepID=UPI0030DFA5E4